MALRRWRNIVFTNIQVYENRFTKRSSFMQQVTQVIM